MQLNCTQTQDFSSTTLCMRWEQPTSSKLIIDQTQYNHWLSAFLLLATMCITMWIFKAKN